MRHSIKKDEPIKEMLDAVVSGLKAKVLERYYGGDESKIPAIDYLGMKPATLPSLPDAHALRTGNEVTLTPPVSLPAAEHWLQVLAGSELNWWHAIVRSEFVVQGTSYIVNPLSSRPSPLCWPEDCHPPTRWSAQPHLHSWCRTLLWTAPTRFPCSRHPL